MKAVGSLAIAAIILISSTAKAEVAAKVEEPVQAAEASPAPAHSTDPLYEFGLAGGAGTLPDYPGSDHSTFRALALPYFVYRGSIIRSDDKEGTRARIIQNDTVDFDFSAAGSFPANSGDNAARVGMPDLDWLAELGPRIEIKAVTWSDGSVLRVLFPVRAVFSTNFTNLVHRGFTYVPGLALNLRDRPFRGWKTYFKAQVAITDEKLARYFFEVEPIYATPTRPAYSVNGGFLEMEYMAGFSVPLADRLRCYGGLWISSLQGSTNQSSPLVRSLSNSSVIFGFTYLFYESEARGEL